MSDTLLLHAEEISVSKRTRDTLVRVAVTTGSTDRSIEQHLDHHRVDIQRVALDRPVDAVPPVRQEGDTLVVSVVEERLVVERRLVLVEEVRIRRVHDPEPVQHVVSCRTQTATITRTPSGVP